MGSDTERTAVTGNSGGGSDREVEGATKTGQRKHGAVNDSKEQPVEWIMELRKWQCRNGHPCQY